MHPILAFPIDTVCFALIAWIPLMLFGNRLLHRIDQPQTEEDRRGRDDALSVGALQSAAIIWLIGAFLRLIY